MPSNALTYSQYTEIVSPLGHMSVNVDKLLHELNMGQISAADASSVIETVSGRAVTPQYDKTGRVYTGFNYVKDATVTTGNAFNSNATTVNRGTIRTPITTTIDPITNTVKAGKIVSPSQVGTRAYVMNSVASPLIAVATGITLGKTIDSALYNANPDFWDSVGMSSLNPDTWSGITSGVDYTDPVTGVSASLFNMIFGLDSDTGEGQAYIDEDAFAYMASWLASKNAFVESSGTSVDSETTAIIDPNGYIVQPITVLNERVYGPFADWYPSYPVYLVPDGVVCIPCLYDSIPYTVFCSLEPFTLPLYFSERAYGEYRKVSDNGCVGRLTTINNKTFYCGQASSSLAYTRSGILATTRVTNSIVIPRVVSYIALFGETISPVDGIGTQENATTPQNLTGNPTTDLPILQQQYPDLWNNAIDYPVVQPDGTIDNHRYIPISLPDSIIEGATQPYTQPVSGDSTQANPKVNPINQEFADYVAKLLQQPADNPLNPDYTPPANPADTGEGSTPLPIAPTGSASALWSIYHPSQAEIDAFGAWLWSPSFIDQIAKIFNNPMESIIGLHKIYATPVDAGTSTIVVGYLDSQVSSAYITQQYVNVDCGSVNLMEQFGNVFDYAPFTILKLYLPFIGIVPLDVSEVMRSTISISYGVDVLTGACLARVNIARDGNNSILYQFAGNCAVQYPLSMGSYMGIVSSILGVAGSAVATFASGGSLAPLAIGAASAAFGAHTSVQNSGNFSGNAGAMGGKKPYLIIERPQTRMADGQESYIGTPANYNSVVGDYSGYVRASSVHLEGVTATDTELDMIQTLLEGGILA